MPAINTSDIKGSKTRILLSDYIYGRHIMAQDQGQIKSMHILNGTQLTHTSVRISNPIQVCNSTLTAIVMNDVSCGCLYVVYRN